MYKIIEHNFLHIFQKFCKSLC